MSQQEGQPDFGDAQNGDPFSDEDAVTVTEDPNELTHADDPSTEGEACVRGRASPAAPHLQTHPDGSLSPTIDIPNPAASATKPPTDTRQGGQVA